MRSLWLETLGFYKAKLSNCLLHVHSLNAVRFIEATPEPGFCGFYEECGRNPTVGGIPLIPPIVPCFDPSAARHLTGEHYLKLKEVCPMMDQGENNTYACCSMKQLQSLDRSLTLSKAVLVRCPSCVENFAHLHCINTCSPNQTQSVKVTKVMNVTYLGTTREAVVAYQSYLSSTFANAAFQSCKNVRIPATGGFAISTMCGRYGAKLCTAQRWYDFQGDSSNGLAPLDIDFQIIKDSDVEGLPDDVIPYNGRALRCNETTPLGGEVCSCQDCQESCPSMPPLPQPPPPFSLFGIDGFFVLSIILLNSLAAQAFMSRLFQRWGTLMASYPLTVILVAAVIVIAFSVGLKSIKLTTDPVELWSAPNSRARQEKDFHDAHFAPFFRTNQLILTAPQRKGHIYDSLLFGKQNFSGLISKDLIIELLELQEKIRKIEFWSEELNSTASLTDVCYAPLNPSNPSPTDCAVNSLPQYFQNSLDNINAKVNMTELGVTKEVDWRDHLIYCLNSPLSFKDITDLGMSCMADYGAPVFSFLAVGGYNDDEYTNAEALILTFSLNNYIRDNPKFKVALQWEKEFLKIVQEYQRNPNANFTFAYMAERSLEDEINRTTAEDIPIFMISYAVIFVYIAVALGEYNSWKRILVDSKFLVGLGGILVVGCSVLASMGFYSWIGIPSSLVILQVVPFLVLAVGADNIFIFVLEYQVCSTRGDQGGAHWSCSWTICLLLFRKYYAPFLLHSFTRVAVMLVFIFMLCASIFLMLNVKVGLDQELAMPQGSYMLDYFKYLYKYFEVGVPVYFVTKRGFNFTTVEGMNAICSSVGCDQFSMTQKIRYATEFPERSYLAIPANSWVDDFIDWLNPGSKCCRLYTFGPNNGNFCPANIYNCMEKPVGGVLRPTETEFNRFLPHFLGNRPDLKCSKGGLGAYDTAVVRDESGEIIASRFMAYHTPLTNSQEFTAALLKARELASNITKSMRNISGTSEDFEVFPYTITNVFYEQYLTIVPEGLFNIGLCLLPTFVVCCLLLGLDLRSGLLNLLTIIMIVMDTVGIMTLWSIDYNAVALINLVTAVGISVEFVSHMTRTFALSTRLTRVERAKEATANMGSAVFAGVAMTNLPGILVLAFAKAQLIQIFFFRLNLVITLLGMAHGLIFLPVLLSYFGPGVNKAVLLQAQQAKQKLEMSSKMREVYDNIGYEEEEAKDTSTTKTPADTNRQSDSIESEDRVDSF
uniref:NPC1 like intracellular cholesterol transporter 1 n=1 Tax=Nothobranchius furzeri TaxID=105023 RepID=A0A8C6VQX4_NOTFU